MAKKFGGKIFNLLDIIVKSVGLVDHPAIEEPFTQFKRAVAFKPWPLAPRDTEWDEEAAIGRLRVWAGAASPSDPTGIDFVKYREGFAWFDENDSSNLESYKLAHHDIVGDVMMTILLGNEEALAKVGTVGIPEAEQSQVTDHLEAHLKEFEEQLPSDSNRAPGKTKIKGEKMDPEMKAAVEELLKSLLEPVTERIKKIEEAIGSVEKSIQEGSKSAEEKKADADIVAGLKKYIEETKSRLELVITESGGRFDKVEGKVADLSKGKSQKIAVKGDGAKTKWPSFSKAFSPKG